MNLNYIFLFLIILILKSNSKRQKLKEIFKEGNEKANRIMIEMGLDKKEIWTKKDFKQFFIKLLDKEDNDERQRIFNEHIAKTYIKKLPKENKKTELYEYIKYEDFIVAIEQTVREQFGEEHVKDVTKDILEMEKEDEEENDDEKNNNNDNSNHFNHTQNHDDLDMDEIDKDL